MVVTFGSQETEPTMLRNKRAACRDGTSADGERNNGVCGAKMPHSTQILRNDREWDTGAEVYTEKERQEYSP